MQILYKVVLALGCFTLAHGVTPAMAHLAINDPPVTTDPVVGVSGLLSIPEPPQSLGLQAWAELQAPILEQALGVTDVTSPWVFQLENSPIGSDGGTAAITDQFERPLTWRPADWIELDFTELNDPSAEQTVTDADGQGWLVIGYLVGPERMASMAGLASSSLNLESGLTVHTLTPLGELDIETVDFLDGLRQLAELSGLRSATGATAEAANGLDDFECQIAADMQRKLLLADIASCAAASIDPLVYVACLIGCILLGSLAIGFGPFLVSACIVGCGIAFAILSLAIWEFCRAQAAQAAAQIAAQLCACLELANRSVDQCDFPELACSCANAADDCIDCEDFVFPLLEQMGLSSCVDGGCP